MPSGRCGRGTSHGPHGWSFRPSSRSTDAQRGLRCGRIQLRGIVKRVCQIENAGRGAFATRCRRCTARMEDGPGSVTHRPPRAQPRPSGACARGSIPARGATTQRARSPARRSCAASCDLLAFAVGPSDRSRLARARRVADKAAAGNRESLQVPRHDGGQAHFGSSARGAVGSGGSSAFQASWWLAAVSRSSASITFLGGGGGSSFSLLGVASSVRSGGLGGRLTWTNLSRLSACAGGGRALSRVRDLFLGAGARFRPARHAVRPARMRRGGSLGGELELRPLAAGQQLEAGRPSPPRGTARSFQAVWQNGAAVKSALMAPVRSEEPVGRGARAAAWPCCRNSRERGVWTASSK